MGERKKERERRERTIILALLGRKPGKSSAAGLSPSWLLPLGGALQVGW